MTDIRKHRMRVFIVDDIYEELKMKLNYSRLDVKKLSEYNRSKINFVESKCVNAILELEDDESYYLYNSSKFTTIFVTNSDCEEICEKVVCDKESLISYVKFLYFICNGKDICSIPVDDFFEGHVIYGKDEINSINEITNILEEKDFSYDTFAYIRLNSLETSRGLMNVFNESDIIQEYISDEKSLYISEINNYDNIDGEYIFFVWNEFNN